jgi:hypothetical protein
MKQAIELISFTKNTELKMQEVLLDHNIKQFEVYCLEYLSSFGPI